MRHVKRAFTLIEILIVVVILGILAAIVIPQFTNAADDAMASSVQSQLQTVRGQIELHNVQTGAYPDFATNGWTDLVGNNYLQGDPRNALRSNATGIVLGTALPGGASGGVATDGWYWNTTTLILYAIAADATVYDW